MNILVEFEKWFREHKQINFYNIGIDDQNILLNIINRMEISKPTELEKPMLQYGMFFDGGVKLYVDEEIVSSYQDEIVYQALLNHIFHYLVGSHKLLGVKPSKIALQNIMSHTGLMFSHFGLSSIKAIYSGSMRNKLYNLHYKTPDFLLFAPHPETSNYFYKKWIKGEIKEMDFLKTDIIGEPFDSIDGYVARVAIRKIHITRSFGLNNKYRFYKNIVLIKNEDGSYERITFGKKAAKELKEIKEVYDKLLKVD